MKAFRIAVVVTVAAVVAVTFVFEHQKRTSLRHQIVQLQEQVQSFAAEKEIAPALNSQNDTSRSLTKEEFIELLKLRSEVGRLRQEIRELESRNPKDNPSQISVPATVPSRVVAFGTELHDVGAATPERAATSLIAAAAAGDQARIAELLELPNGVAEQDASRHYEFFARQLSNSFATMEFTSIQSIKPNPDGTSKLNLVYRDTVNGKTYPFPFMLRLHDSRWKVVVEGDVPGR